MGGLTVVFKRVVESDDLWTGLMVSAVCAVVGLIWKYLPKLLALIRKKTYRDYASSTSFGEEEFELALEGYVHHQGMTTDPSTRFDLADALAVQRRPLLTMLDEIVMDSRTAKHVFIFADCGMGKTTFLINYFHQRQAKLKKKKLSMALVSLSRSGYLDEIRAIPQERHASTVLLMDAFDEDPLVFDGVAKRLDAIVELTSSFRSVVISCRSQFFASDDDIPVQTGAVRTGPTPLGASKEYEFSRLYIAPFDSARVRKYLRVAFPGVSSWGKRERAREMLARVPALVMRPMLLAHISDVLEEENRSSLMSQADIYQAIVSAWVNRESRWVKVAPLLEFSKKLALDLFTNRHLRGGEHCSREELAELAQEWGISIRQELLTGRSLLNRTNDGRCKFAHRSIMEYLVATAIVEGRAPGPVDLTGQIASFIFEKLDVNPSFPDGRLDQGTRLEFVAAESRLGYPTNYSLCYESPEELDASALYGLQIVDETGGGEILGNHVQYMMDHLDERGNVLDVRISVAAQGSDTVLAYISVWGGRAVALSRVAANRNDWFSVFKTGWMGRGFFSVVGKPTIRGDRSSDLSYKACTRCNLPVDILGAESAGDCQVLSVGPDESVERTRLRLIVGFDQSGPLLPFGILRGGSITHLEGRRTRLLHRRELDVETSLENVRDVVNEVSLVSMAERWPVRKNN